jgi:hypothetical protein
MIQTTNTVSFNASSNETVQLPLQSNVTIHIVGSSALQRLVQSFFIYKHIINAHINFFDC